MMNATEPGIFKARHLFRSDQCRGPARHGTQGGRRPPGLKAAFAEANAKRKTIGTS